MVRPTRALVLAAGFGTRLHPLTRQIPKPLLPVWNRPLLLRTLATLREWGVRDVVVNLHHRPGEILSAVIAQPLPGLRLALSFEPDILGTGGAVRKAAWFFDREPFWMINGDVVFDLSPGPLVRAYQPENTIASAWVTKKTGPRSIDVADGRVLSFRSATPGGPGTATFCGVHLVNPRILDDLPDGFSSIITAYERAMQAGWSVAAVEVRKSYWADIGTPSSYLRTHEDLAPVRPVRGGGGLHSRMVCKAPTAVIGKGASLDHVVLLDRSVVAAGASLRNCIVAPGARAAGRIEGAIVQSARSAFSEGEIPSGFRLEHAMIQAYPVRGSARAYTRVRDGKRSVMIMQYDPARQENRLYAGHTRFLERRGLRVPGLLQHDRAASRIVLEDVGDRSLETAFPAMPERTLLQWYRRAIQFVVRFHGLQPTCSLMPPLDAAGMDAEHQVFMTHFVQSLRGVSASRKQSALMELQRARDLLAAQPRVLIHRDFQSSNLMLKGRELVVIDFQGMRLGPAAYDLASLLWDPYVSLSEGQRRRLLADYVSGSSTPVPEEILDAAILQRLTQALGAFVRLSHNPGQESFRRHIPVAVQTLRSRPSLAASNPAVISLLMRAAK